MAIPKTTLPPTDLLLEKHMYQQNQVSSNNTMLLLS